MSIKINDSFNNISIVPVNDMATKYIINWVDKNFTEIYWVEHKHGKIEYDEMGKLVLNIYKEQLSLFLPLTFENELYSMAYKNMKKTLNDLEPINKQFIDNFDIDVNIIRNDCLLSLKEYFKLEGLQDAN